MKTFKQWIQRHRLGFMTGLTTFVVIFSLLFTLGAGYLFNEYFLYGDMTPEGLYSQTEALHQVCERLKGDITITFCQEPDRLMANYETRYIYSLAKQLSLRYDNIHVVTHNILDNPTAVDPYRATTATVIDVDDVIISSGGRYRIYGAPSFWTLGENAEDETDWFSFDGEYKMATAFLAITAVNEPVVCFAYGHGEQFYVPESDKDNAHLLSFSNPDKETFHTLMRNEGLKVSYIDLEKEDIPEDCVLVVMDGPTSDYSLDGNNALGGENALTKLHNFLSKDKGALMLFKDPDYTLPNLEDFAADWGIGFENNVLIQDPTQSLTDGNDVSDDHRFEKLIVELSRDEDSIANAIYGEIASLGTAPRTVVDRSGTVYAAWMNNSVGSSTMPHMISKFFPFFTTSENARRVTVDGKLDSLETGVESLAGISARITYDQYTTDYFYSYCFGAATTTLTSNAYLANYAYSNYDIMFSLVRFISRTDEYASMELGGTSLNSSKLGGKPLVSDTLDPEGNEVYDENFNLIAKYPPITEGDKVTWMLVLTLVPVLLVSGVCVFVLRKRKMR